MIKVGYQGEIGSNNEAAAKQFVKEQGFKDGEYELIPLVESKTVVSNLKNGRIDYGVVATRNSIAGTVVETYEAIKDEYFELVQTVVLRIHHSIFIKLDADVSDIKYVTSHIQALEQTRQNRSMKYPDWEEIENDDTASAARKLADGTFPDSYAVICREEAGVYYGLKPVWKDCEDVSSNQTEFRVFKCSDMDYSEENKPSLLEWFTYQFASENGMSHIAKGIMIVGMFIAILLAQKLQMDSWETATTVGGYTTAVILFFTSNSYRSSRRYKSLEGYWKYYPVSHKDIDGADQKFTTPRIVRICEEDDELRLYGVICDKENVPMFESKSGEVFVSSLGRKKGGLIYAYESPASSQRSPIKGIAYVKWRSKYPAAQINIMKGMYYGTLTGDEGTLTFLRISEKEYEAHRTSTFL